MDLRWQVARLLVNSYGVEEIAAALGLTVSDAEKHAHWVMRMWASENSASMADAVAAEMARLRHLDRESADAWERSQRPARVRRRKYTMQPVSDPFSPDLNGSERVRELTEEVVEDKHRDGTPAFLAERRALAVERLKLLGAYDHDPNGAWITPAQVVQLMNAAMRAVEMEGVSGEQLNRVRQRVLDMLPQEDLGAGVANAPATVAQTEQAVSSESDDSSPEHQDAPSELQGSDQPIRSEFDGDV